MLLTGCLTKGKHRNVLPFWYLQYHQPDNMLVFPSGFPNLKIFIIMSLTVPVIPVSTGLLVGIINMYIYIYICASGKKIIMIPLQRAQTQIIFLASTNIKITNSFPANWVEMVYFCFQYFLNVFKCFLLNIFLFFIHSLLRFRYLNNLVKFRWRKLEHLERSHVHTERAWKTQHVCLYI